METIYTHCSFLVSPPTKHTVQESLHPYQDECFSAGYVSVTGIYLQIKFIYIIQ